MPSDDVVEVFVPFLRSHYGDREATLLGIALAKLVIGDVPQDLAVFQESSAFKRRCGLFWGGGRACVRVPSAVSCARFSVRSFDDTASCPCTPERR